VQGKFQELWQQAKAAEEFDDWAADEDANAGEEGS
jgi:hypothetical protein